MQTLPTPSQLLNQTLPLKIVALGDSLVYGYGDPDGGGWVERLHRQWLSPESAGHVLYNLGIRGNGVAEVGQRLEQEWSLRGELRNRQPDLIILSVGVKSELAYTVGYCGVSSHDQKRDLERQKEVVELFCMDQEATKIKRL